MNGNSRRKFLKESAAALSALGLPTAAAAAQRQASMPRLSPDILRAVAEVVLPSRELQAEGIARVLAQFDEWIVGFQPVAELEHPYLSSPEVRYGPPHPQPRWQAQLEALDIEAQKKHGAGFARLEERIGVAGIQGPANLDLRSKPYPMPPLPMSYNITLLKEWAEKSGIPFWPNPVSKNSQPYRGRDKCMRCDTCNICPVGAKYSPDFTFRDLLAKKRIELYDRTLVRKLIPAGDGSRVEYAMAVDRDRPDDPVHFRAKTFVVASGYAWSPHLLMLSASDRFPKGLANRSGLVGRYIGGHRGVNANVEAPLKLYPGVYGADSLLSRQYQRPGRLDRYVRHDFRIWEARTGREPRLRNEAGQILLGDDILADWRQRTSTGAARMRGYFDIPPTRENALTLDPNQRNEWGDPLPRIDFSYNAAETDLQKLAEQQVLAAFDRVLKAGGGKILSTQTERYHDHPCGGCRMGADPMNSVVDPYGRTHEHENLWVVGAPTAVTAGCSNGTLTFVALALRSAAELGKSLPARRTVG